MAERTFDDWLLNAPPRNTRLLSRRPLESYFSKKVTPQAMAVGLVLVMITSSSVFLMLRSPFQLSEDRRVTPSQRRCTDCQNDKRRFSNFDPPSAGKW